MFCKYCGNSLDDGVNYCVLCGKQVGERAQSNSIKPPTSALKINKNVNTPIATVQKNKNKTALIIPLLAVGVVIAAIGLYLYFVPLSGYNKGEYQATTEEVQSISELYPEVDWTDGNLTRQLWTKVVDVRTVLEEKIDIRTMQYDFVSNTAKVKGSAEINYEFQGGKWKIKSIEEYDETIEWRLEGEYEFVLNDEIYCNLLIDSVDLENGRAHIYWYGSYEDDFSGKYYESYIIDVWNIETKLQFKDTGEVEDVVVSVGDDIEVGITGTDNERLKIGIVATKEDLYCGYKEKSGTRIPSAAVVALKDESWMYQKVGGFKKVH